MTVPLQSIRQCGCVEGRFLQGERPSTLLEASCKAITAYYFSYQLKGDLSMRKLLMFILIATIRMITII